MGSPFWIPLFELLQTRGFTVLLVNARHIISDVIGETGQKILRAIVAAERDGQVLGALKNVRIQATVEDITKSLHGNWRAEHLFTLKQALAAVDFIGTQVNECDRELDQQLQRLEAHAGEPAKGKKRGRARNAPKFDDCGIGSCQIRVPTRRGRCVLAGGRSASPDPHPVRTLVHQSRRWPGGHGSLRFGAPRDACAVYLCG